MKVIENKKIRFSDATCLNDWQEIILLWREYLLEYEGNIYVEFLADKLRENTLHLITCFSENADSKNMWDEYASGGVAVGFSESALQKWSNSFRYGFNAIIMDENKDSCEEILIVSQMVDYFTKDELIQYIKKIVKNKSFDDSFETVFKKAPFLKTKYWEQEKEFRIAINAFKTFEFDNLTENDRYRIEPIESGAGSMLKCDIPFSPTMIKSITLAPNCRISMNFIKAVLEKEGFNTSEIEFKRSIATPLYYFYE